MKNIIYCMNVYDDIYNLKKNIDVVNKEFSFPSIFIASNGIKELHSYDNVNFKYWGENQGWQLGALNSTIQSLKFASESIENYNDSIVVFSHEDVIPFNLVKIKKYIEELNNYDLIVREHNGRWSLPGISYYMLEDFIFNGTYLQFFKKAQIVNSLVHNSAEMTFGTIMNSIFQKDKIYKIKFDTGSKKLEENEMGFIHLG